MLVSAIEVTKVACAPAARPVDAALDITYRYCENPTMTEAVQSPARSPDSYWLTRFVILRLLGCVYAMAFVSSSSH